jgi:hypothetical protein
MKIFIARIQLGLCVLALLLQGACVNLKPIRQFADSAVDTAGYTALTSYYVEGVEHLKSYQDEASQPGLDQDSLARRKQEAGLLALHHGIEAYMTAIGSLASDEVISYDKSLDKLGKELQDSEVASPSEVDAYKSLASFVAKAATDLYRQAKLKQLIGEANGPFQDVVGSLQKIVRRGYVLSLDNEAAALDAYYKDIIMASDRATNAQPALTELVKETWRIKKNDLAARRKACLAYADTLDKIANGHQELYNHRDKLDAKETLDTLLTYANELNNLRTKIKQLNP